MTPSRHGQAFVDQLLALIPGAAIGELTERQWHSATFAGMRMVFQIIITGLDAPARAAAAASALPDHEFMLTRHFVADVTAQLLSRSSRRAVLGVEALLLQE